MSTPTDNAWLRDSLEELAFEAIQSRDDAEGWGKALEAAQTTIQAHIDTVCREAVMDAYENGYNDNARDCYCDGGTMPHKHLLDDGESHDIRPDTAKLNPNKDTEL